MMSASATQGGHSNCRSQWQRELLGKGLMPTQMQPQPTQSDISEDLCSAYIITITVTQQSAHLI